MSSPNTLQQVLRSGGDVIGRVVDRRSRGSLVLAAAVLYALWLAYAVASGGSTPVLMVGGVSLVAFAVFRPELLFWIVVPVVALFDESLYGVVDEGSVFRLHNLTFGPLRSNVDELLVYSLAAVLVVHLALRRRARADVPGSVWMPAALACLVFLGYLAAALFSGVEVGEAMRSFNGKYVLLLMVAFWCFAQVLAEPAVRARLLDVLFVACGARAVFALVRYFASGGDPANPYRELGLKVALWETPDHQLFTFLIVAAIAAALLKQADATRLRLWFAASAPMALTIALSYRRVSVIGLVMALLVLAALLRRQGGGWLSLATVGSVGAGLALMAQRFGGRGPLLQSMFADVDGVEVSRVYEWELAWGTIRRDPLLGGGLMATRQAGIGEWSALFVHNGFLLVWMKLGLIGLASVVTFLAAVALRAWHAARVATRERFLGIAALATVPFVILDVGSGDPLQHARSVMVFALIFALAVMVANRPEEAAHRASHE